jgi:nucleotide-binding universal stress UspA family protein
MYKRILVVVSDRPASQFAIREGVALAKVHGSELLFFCMLEPYVIPIADIPPLIAITPPQFEREAKSRASRLLAAATVVSDKAGVSSRTAVGSGLDDAQCIAEAARNHRCSLIVVGTEGRNAVVRLMTGSVIPGLITLATVPILICRKAGVRGAARRKATSPTRLATRRDHAKTASPTRPRKRVPQRGAA